MNVGETNKCSNAQMDKFLETVIEMIVKGYTRTDILRYFAENEKLELRRSERSVDLYIKKARGEIRKRYKPKRDNILAESLAKLDDLYKKNYTIQDYRECRQVIEALAKLTGINAPEKIANTDPEGNYIQQTPSIIKIMPGTTGSVEIIESE